MSNQSDRLLLLKVARELRDELESRSHGQTFRPASKIKSQISFTDGWCVTLGNSVAPRLRMELWFDHYPASGMRRFYYGLYCVKPEPMETLMRRLPGHLKPVRNLEDRDYERKTRAYSKLIHPLTRKQFNNPIYERYERWPCFFYGVYVPAANWTADRLHHVVVKAADFFSEVMWLPPKQQEDVSANKVAYPQLERSVVRKHLVRERSPQLAMACKRRDGFRCQVCAMTFAEVYGEELGAEFAESHHLRPLSRKRANEKTKVEDLVTVCANCHRMLHLMRGREHDLDELKKRIRRQHRKN
jgi:5-methylcytosine-specific restriction endonuclease McrA